MNHLINRYSISLYKLVFSGLFLILTLTFIFSNISNAGDGAKPRDGKLITIHDRGVSKVVVSKGATIGDALHDAGLSVSDKDSVEPSVDQVMIASEYQINIYRARPVIVIDGAIRQKIITPYQTAEQIAKDADILLFAEDKIDLQLSSNLDDGAGLNLVVTRAIPFTFTLYGKTNIVRTQASTVGDMLKEKDIKLGDIDRLSVDLSTKITENLSIRLWREGKQTLTVEQEVMFDIEKIEDIDQPVGYSLIKTTGEKGSRNVTYEVTIIDGMEVSRQEIASIITIQSKKQIEVVGARGQYTTPSENETITWNFLIANGFSRVQTAGIMGNLMQEHRFRTDGDGLAQWNGSRRAKLYSLPYPNNIYTQLQFLMDELNGGYYKVRNAIKNNTDKDPSVVVRIFQNDFERCNPTHCREDLRISYARNILESH